MSWGSHFASNDLTANLNEKMLAVSGEAQSFRSINPFREKRNARHKAHEFFFMRKFSLGTLLGRGKRFIKTSF